MRPTLFNEGLLLDSTLSLECLDKDDERVLEGGIIIQVNESGIECSTTETVLRYKFLWHPTALK